MVCAGAGRCSLNACLYDDLCLALSCLGLPGFLGGAHCLWDQLRISLFWNLLCTHVSIEREILRAV